MQKIIALVIVLAGIGGGLAMGVVLRSEDKATDPGSAAKGAGAADAAVGHDAVESGGAEHDIGEHGDGVASGSAEVAESDRDYVKIGRQIIIPIVSEGDTRALMLFDLALDVPSSMTERTYAVVPRIRDAFLSELFEMSYTGAFSNTYTDERIIEELRGKLRAAARRIMGNSVREVLILDIMRQEL